MPSGRYTHKTGIAAVYSVNKKRRSARQSLFATTDISHLSAQIFFKTNRIAREYMTVLRSLKPVLLTGGNLDDRLHATTGDTPFHSLKERHPTRN